MRPETEASLRRWREEGAPDLAIALQDAGRTLALFTEAFRAAAEREHAARAASKTEFEERVAARRIARGRPELPPGQREARRITVR